MSKIIGIDLGTTNCCVAVMEGGQPTVIVNAEGDRTTPSVVAFTKDGERLVGKLAKGVACTDPEQSVLSAKRQIGTANKVSIDGKRYCAEQISSILLRKMRETAEAYLGEKVSKAVISVPACFDCSQRQAVADAGRIAGLEDIRIVSESTAVALAYSYGKEDNQKILIFDLGGGHTDVTILDIGDGVYEVLGTSGNPRLGGEDFDQRIADYIADQFKKENGIDLRQDKIAAQRLRIAAEQAKIELSQSITAHISLPYINAGTTGPRHLDMSLTRGVFDQLTSDLVDAAIEPIHRALKDAGLTVNQISHVILTGGCTQIPAVQKAVKKITGKEPVKGIKPDECVATGAAIHGGLLNGEVKDLLVLDVIPISLGVETEGHIFTKLIDRNNTIPTSYRQVFSTASDNQVSVDIHVLQGEWQIAGDNKSLGHYKLTGIAPAPRGVPQIEVTFQIDHNGILQVSARDKAKDKEQQLLITKSANLSEKEITQLITEETKYAERAKKYRERMETLNRADSLLYETDLTMRTSGDRLTSEDIRILQAEIAAFKKVRESNDADIIKNAIDGFTQRVYSIFSKLYQNEPETVTVPDDSKIYAAIRILPVLDDLERAVQAATASSDQNLKNGIENILKKMQGIYKDLGFIEINRPGRQFDPYLENAIDTAKVKNGQAGTVYRVVQKGYMIGNKVIRHAQVIVLSE